MYVINLSIFTCLTLNINLLIFNLFEVKLLFSENQRSFVNRKDEFEDKVLTFFKNIGSELLPRDIEACHRLKKDNDRVIVKFPRRKGCEQIMSVEKDKTSKNAGGWITR